jgi:predicted ATPase
LKELELRILAHDPGFGLPDRAAPAGNLPSLSSELIGRDDEVATLSDLLAGSRLVEVVGPGGIGKTAVAIATGRALAGVPGGVWLVRLEAAQTADDVLDTVIAALNVTGGEAALFERLRRTGAVVILDNCEHVVSAAAALAERLLDAAAGLRILCTSQVALGIDGEAVFELAPLSLSDAVELFTRRAARHGDLGEVHDLCRSLDGLRWRSSSPRRGPGRCRWKRSRVVSTIASAC